MLITDYETGPCGISYVKKLRDNTIDSRIATFHPVKPHLYECISHICYIHEISRITVPLSLRKFPLYFSAKSSWFIETAFSRD